MEGRIQAEPVKDVVQPLTRGSSSDEGTVHCSSKGAA